MSLYHIYDIVLATHAMYITNSGEILLGIQDAAKELGVVPATIRNWEKQGIFSAKRAKNGYRFFTHDDMTRMRN
ncbi:MAG: MerR family transcriptional regulator, partial [Treponema sp.]|nr:MerR family transcriptional regulator [Treponema sp.]